MKVIFHPRFYEVYTSDLAAVARRMAPIVKVLEKEFEFVESGPGSERYIERVHGKNHTQFVKGDPQVYQVASTDKRDVHKIMNSYFFDDLFPCRAGRISIPLPLPTGRQALPARAKSTLRPSGLGSGQRLRVDPEQGFFAPSCKAGLGATEWVGQSSFYISSYY